MPSSDDQTIHQPSQERLVELAAAAGLSLNDQEVEDYQQLVNSTLAEAERVAEADNPRFGVHDIKYTDAHLDRS